jgi:DNA-directed RNA polymerase subunit RPC12/RpoP
MTQEETRPAGHRSGSQRTSAKKSRDSISEQLDRRREAADRLPPMSDGRRDPDLEPDTRYRCVDCKRDVRLRPYVRLTSRTIVCRRCYRDRWAR